MKKIYFAVSIALSVIAFSFILPEKESVKHESDNEAEEQFGRAEWEFNRLKDPATGKIPSGMREKELAFAATLPSYSPVNASTRFSTAFTFRGPINLGGRTRAMAIDVSDENVVIAGSANGGLWRSVNGGVNWTRVSSLSGTQSITWLAQDTRPGKTNNWYYSTGEAVGSSASGGRAYYLGNGLYKSVDGGITWNSVASTASNTAASFDNVWDITWKVVTDPSDAVNNVVYAATYGAIFRSLNGGSTWTLQKGNASGSLFSYYTDVDVTSTGAVYATLSSDGPQKGIWRKDAVNAWADISPPGWNTDTINRVVIGINPVNENEIYFLGETPGVGKRTTNYKGDPEWISFWRYNYISGNGTGAGGTWTDLSPNIPYGATQFGNFNCQGGYDLIVKVFPSNPSVVFIGGTNLYRSDDGFTSTNATTFMGGYDPASTLPMYGVYPNHHSDQHNMVFLPSNPSVMYQANDGGIYKTNDCLNANVVWQDMNNTYQTGQFYTIAIDHGTPGDDQIMGGTQDFGTWLTSTQNNQQPWWHVGLGDGAYCAIDNGHQFYYTSRQQGKLVKSTIDANGNVTAYNRIDPIVDENTYLFINPFVLDPNNNDIMYWAAGNKVWRNDSLTSIPLAGNWDTISTGWFRMPDTIAYSSTNVTSFGVTTSPANRLYVGTNNKYMYRIDNANSNSPVTTEITSSAFPASAYLSCVAVDPLDGDRVIAVISNYSVYSLFLSTDAGVTWSKCAGNLEANSLGTGNGPSLRWASIIPVSNGYVYLVASSTGLYATNLLNGLATIWTQLAPGEIGNLVTDMIDFRTSDGRVVAATHGGGVFSATITDTLLTSVAQNISVSSIEVFPNPAGHVLNIRNEINSASQHISIYSSVGKMMYSNNSSASRLTLSVEDWPRGTYLISIEAGGIKLIRKVVLI